MSLQQNHVRLITLLFEVGFQNIFTKMIAILRQRVTLNILGRYLKGQGRSITLKQNRVRPITSLFQVGF